MKIAGYSPEHISWSITKCWMKNSERENVSMTSMRKRQKIFNSFFYYIVSVLCCIHELCIKSHAYDVIPRCYSENL